MRRLNITFPPVKHHVRRAGKCPVCHRIAVRQRTFYQTVNPYNRNARGLVKTHSEIHAELVVEADGWKPDFTHWGCQ